MLPVESFTRFINENHLFGPQTRVLAAVSGGKDSVLMANLLKAAGYTFGVAHCNFQLRGNEALADEQFCRDLASQLEVPFEYIRFDTQTYAQSHHISIQMAARELRYKWFEQLRQQQHYNVIALAHHQNDTIETILLNLVRGTGIAGLHGIQPVNGSLVRPMLGFTRVQVDELIKTHQLPYREDSSNSSTKYARNMLRLEVIPYLRELNPSLEQTFERNIDHFRQLEALLQQQVEQARQKVFTYKQDEVSLSTEAIKQLSPQRLLMFELLKEYGFNQTTVDDITRALDKHSGRVFESATHQLVTDRHRLLLNPKVKDSVIAVTFSSAEEKVIYGPYQLSIYRSDIPEIIKKPDIAVIDDTLIHYPLTLRSWQQGDEFYPLGMKGRKKLSDFFINQKVPVNHKLDIPILVNGNGEIMWLAGYRLDNRYKVTAQTKKVSIFELQYQPHE